MGAIHNLNQGSPVMASPWRRRRMCVLVTDHPTPAALRDISGSGAFLETNVRPAIASAVRFHHPEAGLIDARVAEIARDGIRIAFSGDANSIAFALAAITSDMTQG